MNPAALSGFRDRFKGQLIGPADPAYDQARVVWNGMADRRPGVIARCTSVEDVVAAIRFAREQDLVIAVRGGGHSVVGFSTCDDGMVIDLSRMNRVTVDPVRRTATAQGGAHLSQLDKQAQAAFLVCPVGVIGHTGVAGLTLGGGMGRLMRKFGLTIDNLLSVDLVTADGEELRVHKDENADLFWGLRGAGANFGIATSFEFQLHHQAPTVTHGWVALPVDRAHEVGRVVRDFMTTIPDELFVNLYVQHAIGPFPSNLAGKPAIIVGGMHSGSPAAAERDLASLRGALDWSVDTFVQKPYLAVQSMGDEANAWGHRFYMKSGFVSALDDELIDICAANATDVPHTDTCSLSFWAMGGAISRVPDEATAFTGRHGAWWFSAEAQWDGPEHDQSHIEWSRRAMSGCKPFTIVGEYVNDAVETDVDSVRAIYGNEKYSRLVGLKRKYDPDNVFRMNQNIRP
jgi:FAD/FMN-containing dehydrogenase